MTTIKLPTPEQLASEFSKLLNEALTPEQMHRAVIANALEATNGDHNVCHSHDYCDANVVMDDAFKNLTGFSTADTTDGTETDLQSGGCMSNDATNLWNAAWSLAKRNGFKVQ